jgi:hypothetical protein
MPELSETNAMPDDLVAALRDDPQAAVAFVTTEHFNLASARGATISETNGRASIFLGSVSAGLVAFAFAAQSSRTALYTFGLVLFPVLVFLGLTTFERVLQTSIDDTVYVRRMNRLRRFYIDAAPGLAGYLSLPAAGEQVEDVLRLEGFRPGPWQLMLSAPGTVGIINSALIGVTVGLAAGALSDSNLWAATIAGLVAFAAAVPAHQRYQTTQRERAMRTSAAGATGTSQTLEAD